MCLDAMGVVYGSRYEQKMMAMSCAVCCDGCDLWYSIMVKILCLRLICRDVIGVMGSTIVQWFGYVLCVFCVWRLWRQAREQFAYGPTWRARQHCMRCVKLVACGCEELLTGCLPYSQAIFGRPYAVQSEARTKHAHVHLRLCKRVGQHSRSTCLR